LNDIDKKYNLHTTKNIYTKMDDKMKPNSTKRAKIRNSSINKFFVKDGFSNMGSKSRVRLEEEQQEHSGEMKLRNTFNKSKNLKSSKNPNDKSLKINNST
jgi:hypothetical protein